MSEDLTKNNRAGTGPEGFAGLRNAAIDYYNLFSNLLRELEVRGVEQRIDLSSTGTANGNTVQYLLVKPIVGRLPSISAVVETDDLRMIYQGDFDPIDGAVTRAEFHWIKEAVTGFPAVSRRADLDPSALGITEVLDEPMIRAAVDVYQRPIVHSCIALSDAAAHSLIQRGYVEDASYTDYPPRLGSKVAYSKQYQPQDASSPVAKTPLVRQRSEKAPNLNPGLLGTPKDLLDACPQLEDPDVVARYPNLVRVAKFIFSFEQIGSKPPLFEKLGLEGTRDFIRIIADGNSFDPTFQACFKAYRKILEAL